MAASAGSQWRKTGDGYIPIPFILVIDQNGYLYRKNVRGQQIQEAICECLTSKPTQGKKKSQRIKAASMM